MRLQTRCMFAAALALTLIWLCAPQPEPSAQAALRKPEQPVQARAPEFPWASFQRFWNIHCLAGCEIQDPHYVDGRYVVQYTPTVSMVVFMEAGVVRYMTAYYTDVKGTQGGGQFWLKLVDSIIRIGAYRWPDARTGQVRGRFLEVSLQPAEYKWQTSWFKRAYIPSTGWEFTLNLLPYVLTDEE